MIKEAYVSYEVAMLLKEKGFREYVYHSYDGDVRDIHPTFIEYRLRDFNNGCERKKVCSAPTQQMAMDWLREKHGLHITIMFSKYLYGDSPFYWSIDRMIDDKREKTSTATGDYTYKSYRKAVEGALEYALKNLI